MIRHRSKTPRHRLIELSRQAHSLVVVRATAPSAP
jgi:hypothetical protein